MKKLLFLLTIPFLITGCFETKKGEKIGTMVKCGWEGFFFKTYECEIITGGMDDGSGSFGKSFHFTVENKRTIELAEEAMDNQQVIKLRYHQELFASPARTLGNGSYFGDEIIFRR